MITLIIIIITSAVSILCFRGMLNINALKFNAYDTLHRNQWYRMLSYGLVHGSWGHLFFNMLTLTSSVRWWSDISRRHSGIRTGSSYI